MCQFLVNKCGVGDFEFLCHCKAVQTVMMYMILLFVRALWDSRWFLLVILNYWLWSADLVFVGYFFSFLEMLNVLVSD